MRFEAATTLDQAVALLAGAQGRARIQAGAPISWCRSGPNAQIPI